MGIINIHIPSFMFSVIILGYDYLYLSQPLHIELLACGEMSFFSLYLHTLQNGWHVTGMQCMVNYKGSVVQPSTQL